MYYSSSAIQKEPVRFQKTINNFVKLKKNNFFGRVFALEDLAGIRNHPAISEHINIANKFTFRCQKVVVWIIIIVATQTCLEKTDNINNTEFKDANFTR